MNAISAGFEKNTKRGRKPGRTSKNNGGEPCIGKGGDMEAKLGMLPTLRPSLSATHYFSRSMMSSGDPSLRHVHPFCLPLCLSF